MFESQSLEASKPRKFSALKVCICSSSEALIFTQFFPFHTSVCQPDVCNYSLCDCTLGHEGQ